MTETKLNNNNLAKQPRTPLNTIDDRVMSNLQEIKNSIDNESISYFELYYLMDHKQEVLATGDILLCEFAGITEQEYKEYYTTKRN